MLHRGPRDRLPIWGRIAIFVLIIACSAFSALTLYRSAFADRRMTDAGVYFRAGWAVRAGVDPYTVLDDNGWSYTYPPTLAVLMAPLADAPPGQARPWMLPYWASVSIWLLASWGFLVVAAQWTARAVEESSPDPQQRSWPRGSLRWWQHRIHPLLLCLVGVCATISRGQVNLLLLMMLAGMALCVVRGKGFGAGMWLAAATCLKVIPIFLLLFAIWKRDKRQVAGFVAGMVLFLGVLPAVTVGPQRALDLNRRFLDTMILSRYGNGEDQSKVHEHDLAIDNQSIMAAMFNARHPGAVQETALIQPDRVDKLIHGAIGMCMIATTLGLAWKRRGGDQRRVDLLVLGMLICVMLAVSPLTHLHYFVLALPLVATLCAAGRERGTPGVWMWVLALAYFAAGWPPHMPGSRIAMYLGLAAWTNIALWAAGAWTLGWGRSWRRPARAFDISTTEAHDEVPVAVVMPVEPLAAGSSA
jgi:hypothetical protein